MNSRRDALKALIVAAAASHAAFAQHEHGSPELVQIKKSTAKSVAFSAEELALTAVLVDLILPRSDTPGASDVGVPLILDAVAGKNAVFKKQWQAGLKWLNEGRNFRSLPQEEQVAVLTPVSRETTSAGGKFFKLAKDSTIDAYYSTRDGLMTELGWHGNTFLKEFKGCTHPEHQV
ncbi:MAG: gluconate 2-dehydrogenase subunit 3 family protein [Bryobacteraceae bacterium]